MDNVNLELHKMKQENKDNPYLNTQSIRHMFKTIEKYMNYSRIKDLYETVLMEEGKKYDSDSNQLFLSDKKFQNSHDSSINLSQ